MANTERIAKRVLIDIRQSSIYVEKGWDDPNSLIRKALRNLKKKDLIPSDTENKEPDVRLIIQRAEAQRTRIVVDIFHSNLDVELAHLYGQDLPVLIVSMRRGDHSKAFLANPIQQLAVNFEVRIAYNYNRVGSRPPFIEDFREGDRSKFQGNLMCEFRDWDALVSQQQDLYEARHGKPRCMFYISAFCHLC